MKPPARRGGYFKARSALWLKAHTEARWTPENPAPKWWAELDTAWSLDAGILPSIRDYADFLGWKKGAVEGLLQDVYGDIERWTADKSRTKSGQREDSERTGGGQPAEVGGQQEQQKQDSRRTVGGQSADTSRARSSKQTHLQTASSEFQEREDPAPPPPQPEAEPDWEAIQAKILGSLDEARDAEIEGYFVSPIEPPPAPPKPEPTTRKPAPDFGALFGGVSTPKPVQPQAEPEEAGLPPDLDLLQMLTSRPDGAQAAALGVATRWVRLLTSQGIDSPGDLQRYTVREIQMLPGMSAPSAGHVQAALEAWGGEMAKGGRELVDDLRRRVLRNDSSLTAAEKRQMDAANLRTSDIKKMSDYDVNTYAQRLDAARSRM